MILFIRLAGCLVLAGSHHTWACYGAWGGHIYIAIVANIVYARRRMMFSQLAAYVIHSIIPLAS